MSGHSHFAIIQYDGRRFAGWQRQARDRTVQAEFETALARLAGAPVTCHAAGRTDSGVHALGQVASFRLPKVWDRARLTRALNANTPDDIFVVRSGPAVEGFHARKHATSRRYRYVVGCDEASRSPFRAPFEWALARPLDAALLQRAAARLPGEHDFRGLSSTGQEKPHYRCTVTQSCWRARPNGEGFIFTVEANRFLHRMVRFLVGAMVGIARGDRAEEDLAVLLASSDNRHASPPAPPQGLYFVEAQYPLIEREDTS